MRKLIPILILACLLVGMASLACMTTATQPGLPKSQTGLPKSQTGGTPGATLQSINENEHVDCFEPVCQLAPTATATVATTAESDEPAGLPTEPQACLPTEPQAGAVYEIPTAAALCATVTAIQSLHLRDQPNEQARVLAYLHNGEQVRVIAYLPASRGQAGGNWWKISTTKGTGYANSKYLSLTECRP